MANGGELEIVSGIMPTIKDYEIIGNAINFAARCAHMKRSLLDSNWESTEVVVVTGKYPLVRALLKNPLGE